MGSNSDHDFSCEQNFRSTSSEFPIKESISWFKIYFILLNNYYWFTVYLLILCYHITDSKKSNINQNNLICTNLICIKTHFLIMLHHFHVISFSFPFLLLSVNVSNFYSATNNFQCVVSRLNYSEIFGMGMNWEANVLIQN